MDCKKSDPDQNTKWMKRRVIIKRLASCFFSGSDSTSWEERTFPFHSCCWFASRPHSKEEEEEMMMTLLWWLFIVRMKRKEYSFFRDKIPWAIFSDSNSCIILHTDRATFHPFLFFSIRFGWKETRTISLSHVDDDCCCLCSIQSHWEVKEPPKMMRPKGRAREEDRIHFPFRATISLVYFRILSLWFLSSLCVSASKIPCKEHYYREKHRVWMSFILVFSKFVSSFKHEWVSGMQN